MNTEYFEQWANFVKKAQKPVQELAQLNLETLKKFDAKQFEKLLDLKKPQEILEFQMNFAIEQGKNSIDYLKKSIDIVEKSGQDLAKEVKAAKDKK